MLLFLLAGFFLVGINAHNFVTYIDGMDSWYDTGILQSWGVPGYSTHPYNVINLAFYISSSGPTDALLPWVNPTGYFSTQTMQKITGLDNPTDTDFRNSIIKLYHEKNIKLLVCAFGSTDYPTNSYNPNTLAKQLATFVKTYSLDGIDIDWEDTQTFNSNGNGEIWLVNLTNTLRENLPYSENYIITHAPQAPYFMGTDQYPKGGYLYVHQLAGSNINWYNVQFYNQATSSYNTFSTLFVSSNGWATNSAVYQMIQGSNNLNVKIPSSMIIVGKPVTTADVSNTGWIEASELESIFETAINSSQYPSWSSGFMTWEFRSDENNNNFQFSYTVSNAF